MALYIQSLSSATINRVVSDNEFMAEKLEEYLGDLTRRENVKVLSYSATTDTNEIDIDIVYPACKCCGDEANESYRIKLDDFKKFHEGK